MLTVLLPISTVLISRSGLRTIPFLTRFAVDYLLRHMA